MSFQIVSQVEPLISGVNQIMFILTYVTEVYANLALGLNLLCLYFYGYHIKTHWAIKHKENLNKQ